MSKNKKEEKQKEQHDGENTFTGDPPWLDIRLSKEAMNHLWDCINNPQNPESAKHELAGNISKSTYIEDKNNWFYETILKEITEYVYYKNWINYYNVHVTKANEPQIFELRRMWVNYQKQHEFNPPHSHDGIYSFVVFMKIPTHWKDQHALPWLEDVNEKFASNFVFHLGVGERVRTFPITLTPEDKGRMLFFPAWLKHQVFPFYECEEERITMSGNIYFPSGDPKDVYIKQEGINRTQ